MGKEKTAIDNPVLRFLREMFQLGLYKRSQGKIARQITAATVFLGFALAAWRISAYEVSAGRTMQFVAPAILVAVGAWFAFRLVNLPAFADFLIAVEAEMNKVSWPTKGELFRSSVVVIFCIVFLALILFAYDLFWRTLLHVIGVTG